jgi:hypothetical protein
MRTSIAQAVRSMRLVGNSLVVANCLLVVAACAAASSPGASGAGTTPGTSGRSSGTAPGTDRSLVGTWVGDYSYPLATAGGAPQAIRATETLVIEKQEGDLLWGVDQYVEDGNTIKIPVRGTLDAAGPGVTLAEQGGFFRGELQADGTLRVRFTRTDDQFTSFEVTLRRQ